MSGRPSKCPVCQGEHLQQGRAGVTRHTFIPDDLSGFELLLNIGYPASAFVCLTCGFMGTYLDATTLRQLRLDGETRDRKRRG